MSFEMNMDENAAVTITLSSKENFDLNMELGKHLIDEYFFLLKKQNKGFIETVKYALHQEEAEAKIFFRLFSIECSKPFSQELEEKMQNDIITFINNNLKVMLENIANDYIVQKKLFLNEKKKMISAAIENIK